MMWRFAWLLLPFSNPAFADSLIAARTVQAHSTLVAADMILVSAEIPNAVQSTEEAVGYDTVTVIFAGQPILLSEITRISYIERNQLIIIRYEQGGLLIETAGRALDKGTLGETIQAINLGSKKKISGKIIGEGKISTSTEVLQ
jgi:flagella basal body P-ring formation protein FlgA